MFENIPTPLNQSANQPANEPVTSQSGGAPKPAGGVDDIFLQTDTGVAPPAPEKITLPPGPSSPPTSSGPDKKYFLIGLIVLLFILVVAGAVWAVKNYGTSILKKNVVPQVNTNQNGQPASNEEPKTEEQGSEAVNNIGTSSEINASTSTLETPPQLLDSDEDGLTDEEEDELGTDKTSSDTDSDGLFDREEVKVYKTNPTNSDTDGDGYKDGDEVKDGYNPKGSGKLYEVK